MKPVITKFNINQQPIVGQQPILESTFFTQQVRCGERPKDIENVIISQDIHLAVVTRCHKKESEYTDNGKLFVYTDLL